jgi:hypothetical protein
MLAKVNPDILTTAFEASLPDPGAFALEQHNGRFKPATISKLAAAPSSSERIVWIRIPASLFRIGVVQGVGATKSMGVFRLLFFIVGLVLLGFGLMLKFRPYQPPEELEEDPVQIAPSPKSADLNDGPESPLPQQPGSVDLDDGLGAIELPDLGFSLEKMPVPHKKHTSTSGVGRKHLQGLRYSRYRR